MSAADGYFGERVAATYDQEHADMFAPAAVEPTVEMLARLAGAGDRVRYLRGTHLRNPRRPGVAGQFAQRRG